MIHIFNFITTFIASILLIAGIFMMWMANSENVENKVKKQLNEEDLKKYKEAMNKMTLRGGVFIIIAISLIIAKIFC